MVDANLDIQDLNLTRLKQPSIHLLTQVQPHGVLLVLQEPDLTVLQASQNTATAFGISAAQIITQTLDSILDSYQVDRFREALAADNLEIINPTKVWVRHKNDDYRVFDAIFHRSADGFLVLELEPALTHESIPFLSFYHLARASINQLEATSNLQDFCQVIVQEVRNVTGFDRVMLYKFDDDGHGEVLAEDKLDEMESYLGLHYPESDIPQPARKMFLSNWIRVIPDAKAEAVPLYPAQNPITQQPVDLTLSILRSAYPCHLEYLHNMGVGSSLTISLMKDQQLWGLIACHHRTPKYIPYELRKACEFLGRVIFAEISTREEEADHNYRLKLANVQSALIEQMSEDENFIDGLVQHEPNLLDLANAKGAAICFGGRWTTLGQTPSEEELNYLAQWLGKTVDSEIFYTDSLPLIYSDAERFKDVASGLLAIPISKRSYVLWFRPEVIQTVNWGGDPHHAYELKESGNDLRLCPRKSFELWKETVRLKSLPWKPVEIKATLELRKAIVNIVLRQAEELAILAQDLERSNAELKKFAYVASHDLQEPLNQVANYVQLLEMRYHSQLDNDATEFIDFAVEGVSLMQTLIDDVLAYSKVDLQGIDWELTTVGDALKRALNNLRGRIGETEAEITFDPMPTIVADGTQLMQLFQNLVGNAIKFKQKDQAPKVHIGVQRQEEAWLFSVKDNGIGFDPQFSDRIFVIFQRLHTRDEYPGSGMGLAICKKIVECHRGRIWVESELGQGSTFYFTIPVGGRDRNHVSGRKKNYLFGGR
ncbi:GAF domain-containing protein [Desertifilum sp. FACHB-1129]|uniref:histidine kinase n=1 Tax=Desertifilum tharense IPPAS B-1220 TaxID=1781255 RepID=A0A1E5QGU9_9CYAN|nr:ATP-binding protein [Desertifilum tharense]MBD2311716.1 GAF domain-containing protein [Desertifilum sp. FACHB-1129]MBD2322759.1 GAF domain-containing protein [Desertifilum sp. FACHB-866]MBD2332847.1 GAF domain-containing protein [Desertifilum sp. FACHB-868]MDA0212407.1 ATP-binding protein [Cyanobacteria bacterium FC1]OEJ73533.1 cyanobacterial phytochrome A [Desertifilum tharense IPPAS B-1220]